MGRLAIPRQVRPSQDQLEDALLQLRGAAGAKLVRNFSSYLLNLDLVVELKFAEELADGH